MDIIIAGITACLAMDIFQRILLVTTGQPPSNWAVVGRWACNVLRTARFYQPDIESTDEIKGEHAFGWVVHYAVGIGYAFIYAEFMQRDLLTTSLSDGLLFGFLSDIIPWLYFLPVLGKGIMAKHTCPCKSLHFGLSKSLCVRTRHGRWISAVCLEIRKY